MPARHDDHPDQTLDIIRSVTERERELGALVEQAKAEAQRMLEQAQSDAARIRGNAATEAARVDALHRKRMEAVAAEITAARGALAQQEAEQLRSGAAAKLEAAVSEVVNRVLPEKA